MLHENNFHMVCNQQILVTRESFKRLSWRYLLFPIAAMALVIVVSNILVQHAINDWLTWGAFSYPFIFLVSDLTNRTIGPSNARRVVFVGFAIAVVVSLYFATWRIALASGSAFLFSQLMDILVFNRWRQSSWWKAPLFGSAAASVVDTLVFFAIAFAGTQMNWLMLGAGDISMKWLMALVLLAPYRLILPFLFEIYSKFTQPYA